MSETTTPPSSDQRQRQKVDLSAPITRGDTQITAIELRKPKAGELRGLTLQDVIGTDIVALLTLIPRISEPPLTAAEVNELEPEDLSEIGGTIRGFFMTRAERMMLDQLIAEQRPRT